MQARAPQAVPVKDLTRGEAGASGGGLARPFVGLDDAFFMGDPFGATGDFAPIRDLMSSLALAPQQQQQRQQQQQVANRAPVAQRIPLDMVESENGEAVGRRGGVGGGCRLPALL